MYVSWGCAATEPIKFALSLEIKSWIQAFGRALKAKYHSRMEEIVQFVVDYGKKLSRPVNDLEDVRNTMSALEGIRQRQTWMDMSLGPVEVKQHS